uniref:DUF5675 domain-containing protein n=1 Tax=uncultured bacterium fosmid pJB83B9 TaxID=1478070 RepID=A0A0H3U9W1_9BACT|nr:hypothetical protein [uncultured bacterium fosmid pJB83B9]
MKIVVDRKYKKSNYTIGRLSVDGKFICNTLEDAVRGVKIPGITAIPAGLYEIDMATVSPKFMSRLWARPYNGIVPRLKNVPGFEGILIHPGNNAADTDGCILVGRNTEVGRVLQSVETYFLLMDLYLVPAFRRREKITIELH